MSFPRYNTVLGSHIKDWLTDKSDDIMLFEKCQTLDKVTYALDMMLSDDYNSYDVIIFDRSYLTQLAYAQIENNDEQIELALLTSKLSIPIDTVIYCVTTPELSMSRQGEHGDNDKYESDLSALTKVQDNFEELLIRNKTAPFETLLLKNYESATVESLNAAIDRFFEWFTLVLNARKQSMSDNSEPLSLPATYKQA